MMALPAVENSGVYGPGGMSLGGGLPPDIKMIPHVFPAGFVGRLGPVDVLHGFDELLGPPPLPNGFLFQGAQVDAMVGAYRRNQELLQVGQQVGNYSAFFAYSHLYDHGFVPISSASASQYHADIGYRSDSAEFHLKAHVIDSAIEPQEPQPPSGVPQVPWTNPNVQKQLSYQIDLTGNYLLDNGWVASSDVFVGHYRQRSATVVLQAASDDGGGAAPPGGGGGVPAPTGTTGILTTLGTDTTSYGATAKLTNHGTLFGMANTFDAGFHYTGGVTTSSAHTYFANMTSDYSNITSIIGEIGVDPDIPANGVYPNVVRATTNYLDLHVVDVIDVTDRLKVSATGRFDYSQINQYDLLGTDPTATGDHAFTHFSPSIGATYAVTPDLLAYAGYSEAAHVGTPAGIICDDMELPCSFKPPFFVTEQVLPQTVTHTYEAGFRGQLPTLETPIVPVQAAWHAGVYRTDATNDLFLYVDINKPGRPVFYDVGDTRRQGVKLGLDVVAGQFTTSIIYNYTDATFQSPVTLYNPLNTAANAAGNIYVKPGDQFPLIPAHSLKILAKYQVTPEWSVGASMRAQSSTYYSGDEVNAMQKVPGYFITSLNTSYRITKDLEVFGLVENIFNKKYAVFGALIPGGTVSQSLQAPRWVYGQPLSIYAGFRWKFL
ncbi:hypothetical protein CR492_19090 [Methylocella silvestris]|uniref:TonB-dependent receptor-like beta-barrel domain-containing protein n=2 Tax=Methylocella silvestris TaxID=199596 RepID=A0A2J7TC99_METSI|nr:hypothetical protein CR492_19090 [Methylocella silvestris]